MASTQAWGLVVNNEVVGAMRCQVQIPTRQKHSVILPCVIVLVDKVIWYLLVGGVRFSREINGGA